MSRRRIFIIGLVCATVVFTITGYFSVPGFDRGTLEGEFLHPHFGAGEFAEVLGLAFLLCFLVVKLFGRHRSNPACIAFASGFALFATALLVIEARIQSYGPIIETVLKSRYGSKESILFGAVVVGVLGLLVSGISTLGPRSKPKGKGKRARKKNPNKARAK